MRRRRLSLALALVVAGAVALAFGPFVRSSARAAAERYGVRLEIRRVLPAWGGVRLLDVNATASQVPFAALRLDEVVVSVGWLGSVRRVELRGGELAVRGAPSEVAERIRAFRAAHAGRGRGDRESSGRELAARGLTVTWSDLGEGLEPLVVRGARLDRNARGETTFGAEMLTWAGHGAQLIAKEAAVALGHDGERTVVQALHVEGLEVAWTMAVAPEPAPSEGGVVPAAAQHGNPPPRSPTGDRGVRLRDRATALAALVAGGVAPDAKIEVGGLYARVRHADQTLNVGPGKLRVGRDGDRVVVDLVPGGNDEPSPLTLHASVPTRAGPIEVDLRGGPVTLASLGAHDKDFGLADVDRGTLDARLHAVLSADARTVTFDGEGRLRSLSLFDKRLADDTVRGLDLAWRARGEAQVDGSLLRIDDGELDLGAIRLQGEAQLERADAFTRVRAAFTMPLASCESMLESLPRALVPRIAGMTMAGTFALSGKVAFDTRKLDDMQLSWDAANGCRITGVPADVDVARFRQPFKRMVYDGEGHRTEIVSGPGTPDWVPLVHVSPFVEAALTTTEDGGFRRHHGFDKEAIKNSIRDNLKAGKFLRGASTLSMQLAKNLYLERQKTVSRKLQEAILTMYLEQELTKDQILELYLNVVEFGPMLYGIGPAAQSYFQTSANDLSLGQALYLSSILPNPKKQYFGAGGRVADGWMGYLHKLMKLMLDRHRINDEELADGLSEVVTWHVPRSPRTKGPMALPDGAEGDSGWLPPLEGP